MGSFRSGRRGGAATAEATASFVIDVRVFRPAFQHGKAFAADTYFDEGRFHVGVVVDCTDESDRFVELRHRTRDDRHYGRIVTDRVQLTATTPNFGGSRWWLVCPRTGRRTTKLLLPNGGWHFWSRQAYGLGYASQREGLFDRLHRRAATLNRQLGGRGWQTWDERPVKP